MTIHEAMRLVSNEFPNRIIDNVTETENYFLVNTIKKKDQGLVVALDDGLKAVSKHDKKIFTYNPLKHGR